MGKALLAVGLVLVIGIGAWKLHVFHPARVVDQSGNPFGTTTATAPEETSSTTPDAPTDTPPGAIESPGKTLSLSLTYAGTKRTYLLHVPSGYSTSKKYPLLFSFHGNGGTGQGQESKTKFDAIADTGGFFVAYPDSDPNYLQGGQWKLTGTTNDILFGLQLLSAIESEYSIDASRVYVSGHSEGGGITHGLACTATSKFAGFAVISTDLNDGIASKCQPSATITAIYFHGTADPVSYYAGGNYKGGSAWSAQKTAEFWVGANGCNASAVTTQIPDKLSDGSQVTDTKQVWSGCNNGTTVTFYTITDGGHGWPGGAPSANDQLGPSSVNLNASQIIWDTLSQHRR